MITDRNIRAVKTTRRDKILKVVALRKRLQRQLFAYFRGNTTRRENKFARQ